MPLDWFAVQETLTSGYAAFWVVAGVALCLERGLRWLRVLRRATRRLGALVPPARHRHTARA